MFDGLELRPHPARRYNEITGQEEPLITDALSVVLRGELIGYCGAVPNRPIGLIRYFTQSERDLILEFVASRRLQPTTVNCPPKAEVPPLRSDLWFPAEYLDDDDAER